MMFVAWEKGIVCRGMVRMDLNVNGALSEVAVAVSQDWRNGDSIGRPLFHMIT
jgi:hypothetical protein